MTEEEAQRIMDWLQSDSLDWDAVASARDEAWARDIPTTAGHRHAGHDFTITEYPCGCWRVSCHTCNITDGFGGTPGPVCAFDFSKGIHPALTGMKAF